MNRSANQLVEHFFRHESANLIAVLTRAFGIRRIDLIEDMVQVAMLEALQAWKLNGVPENPAAWLHQKSKHRILDAMRREKAYEKALTWSRLTAKDQESMVDYWLEPSQVSDSLLQMIFVCCHPSLEKKTQIALTLKTLCGFGISEIARGLMLPKETVKKRIQRAKHSLSESNVKLELPRSKQLAERLNVVHESIYLMFNEGYSTSKGAKPIRDDICEEAARLCYLLCDSPCSSPSTKALLALILFQSSRLEARVDSNGDVILLEDQDRTQWDQRLIGLAKYWLAKSRAEQPTVFHLEAGIAMQHCISPNVESTNWHTIIDLYQRLLQLRDSPVYLLNQAIALGEAGDTGGAMYQLESLRQRNELSEYLLLDCAIARIHELEDRPSNAIDCYLAALSKSNADHEEKLIQRKLQRLSGR